MNFTLLKSFIISFLTATMLIGMEQSLSVAESLQKISADELNAVSKAFTALFHEAASKGNVALLSDLITKHSVNVESKNENSQQHCM